MIAMEANGRWRIFDCFWKVLEGRRLVEGAIASIP